MQCRTSFAVCSRLTISALICFVWRSPRVIACFDQLRGPNAGFLSKNWNGYSVGFLSLALPVLPEHGSRRGDRYRTHLRRWSFPRWSALSTARKLMYAYDLAAEGLTRHEPGFSTAPVVGRLDAHPSISLPTFLHGWTFRPEARISRNSLLAAATERGESAVGNAISDAINRNVVDAAMEIGHRPCRRSSIANSSAT